MVVVCVCVIPGTQLDVAAVRELSKYVPPTLRELSVARKSQFVCPLSCACAQLSWFCGQRESENEGVHEALLELVTALPREMKSLDISLLGGE